MRRISAALVAMGLATLAACGQASSRGLANTNAPASAPSPSTNMVGSAGQGEAAARVAEAPGGPSGVQVGPAAPPAATLPLLAFSYATTLEAPNDRVAALMRGHEQACLRAGPSVCQVKGADLSTDRTSDAVRGTLTLRATPEWLTTFRAGLERDAQGAGGRLIGSQTTSEDLTRAIVDTEAALRAKTTLRDRLQQLLATRSGSVADLVEAERALAQVQGEIDAANSELQMMRTRVATSDLTLTYQSALVAVSGGTWEPLRSAADNFLNLIVWALAGIVTLVAVLIPFVVIGGPILWLILRARRRGAERRRAAALRASEAPVTI